MKLINADYLTGRIFTEADLTNAHTCYESIMAIIESMESDDVLDKIRAEIESKVHPDYTGHNEYEMAVSDGYEGALRIIDKYKAKSEGGTQHDD